MSISTKKGDSGYTSTLSGERVPKYHIITEAVGSLDEASSLLGLARASSTKNRVKRILLLAQKHLLIIGAEFSATKGKKPLKRIISETEVRWIEELIDRFEEAIALPPGFVTFGQERTSAQMDVARTAVRKVERIVAKMHSEGLVGNTFILKYFNRLSDLIFLLACLEEKKDAEQRKINRALLASYWCDPCIRKIGIFIGSLFFVLVSAIVLILIFHRPDPEIGANKPLQQMRETGSMHISRHSAV